MEPDDTLALRKRRAGLPAVRSSLLAGHEGTPAPDRENRVYREPLPRCPSDWIVEAVVHALSIDVEDWYHDWMANGGATPESRVEANTQRLLELIEPFGVRATFFFLGQVAHRFPHLVRVVAAAGHEIGSHGYRHCPVTQMTRREFREDVSRSLRVIEDAAGVPVRGYRAPYFSIKPGVEWPVLTLTELGLRYDSSILPIDRAPGLALVCPRRPFQHASGLWEVPVAILQLLHFWHLPLASGAGLRNLPFRRLERWVRRFERDVGAGVFYLHPWELDPDSPTAPQLSRRLLRVGRRHLPERLTTLLQRFRFAPITEVFGDRLGAETRDQDSDAPGRLCT